VTAALVAKASCGNEMLFRVLDGKSLDEEWAKLSNAPGSAEAAWDAAVRAAQEKLKAEAGFEKTVLVESIHP
jgi:hypothetical protein